MTVRPDRPPRASAAASRRSSRSAHAGQPGPIEIPIGPRSARTRTSRAQRIDEAELATLDREHRRARRAPADPRDRDHRRLPARRRRAPPAGRDAAGLERIPAVVRQLADREQLELALVENLQRADLNPIEAARAYRQLIDEFGFTQEQVAERVGRARSTVANTLRLLDLAPGVQARSPTAASPKATPARSAASRPSRQDRVLDPSSSQDLSVRQTEELVRRAARAASEHAAAPADGPPIPTSSASRRTCGARSAPRSASRARAAAAGSSIEYYSDEDLGRLYERLTGGTA